MDTLTTEPFVVMAKPVGSLCNLKCGYCYYLETGGLDRGAELRCMTDELLETFIRRYIEASAGTVVPFTWHGGEPTLAGLGFYRRAVELQKKYLPESWVCWNNLQTNGVLLDDEWCEFLAENHFDVGLSIDGARRIHDEYRRDYEGRGSYERAAAAVRRLQARGIQPDLLCTVTSSAAKEPLAVYRTLRELGTGWIQFIPIVRHINGQVAPESVTPDGYGDFLCAVFDEWALHDIGRLEVQLFAEMALVRSGGDAGLCWMSPACGRALIVERDGGVYSCDHFVDGAHRLGNLLTSPLRELAALPEQRRFGENKRTLLPALCRKCPWLALCNGGCPKDRFAVTEDGEAGLNYLCGGLRRFFAHAEPGLKQITRLRARGVPPGDIMARLRAEALSLWKGVGRNDPCPCGSGRKAKNCCWSRRP